MNASFDLLSSMSPKVKKNHKPMKTTPTTLVLKKYFRKSLNIKITNSSRVNESVITLSSTSSSSKSPILISESEKSFTCYKRPVRKAMKDEDLKQTSLSKEKYKTIQHWVDDVNGTSQDVTRFSEVSTVVGDDNPGFKNPRTNIAVSSTFLECAKRFDEVFKSDKVKQYNSKEDEKYEEFDNDKDNSIIKDSLVEENMGQNFENLTINDSLKLSPADNLDENHKEPKKNLNFNFDNKMNRTPCSNEFNKCKNLSFSSSGEKDDTPDYVEYEDLLDSLYGYSWRKKKDDVLPSSERKVTINKEITKKVPNSERPAKKKPASKNPEFHDNESNLLKIFQKARFKKALESPWSESLKKVCDSDTDSDSSDKNGLIHVKLNFEDNTDDGLISSPPHYTSKEGKTKISRKPKLEPLKNVTTYSFLASLSGSIPLDQCDMSAFIFRSNFQQHKEKLATRLFQLYNEKVFDNLLPQDTKIEWNDRLRGTAGKCICKKITRRTGAIERTATIMLAKKVLDSADRLRDTFIHELCHAATWIINEVSDGHGSFWKAWANRAMKVFPELPPIKRCHSYVINTKYSYRCTGCGYTIGRHSKSLDTQRKRCGYCMGTFEVLINKTSKGGETKSVPATPKKPNQFALFVKENYANFKSPDLNHGDVMKLLSSKFANMKVQNVNKS